jgi:hypothetical protein
LTHAAFSSHIELIDETICEASSPDSRYRSHNPTRACAAIESDGSLLGRHMPPTAWSDCQDHVGWSDQPHCRDQPSACSIVMPIDVTAVSPATQYVGGKKIFSLHPTLRAMILLPRNTAREHCLPRISDRISRIEGKSRHFPYYDHPHRLTDGRGYANRSNQPHAAWVPRRRTSRSIICR